MTKYPELAKLMATQSMERQELAEIINKTPAAITKKLSGVVDFKFKECLAITKHFKKFKPRLTMEFIFSEVEQESIENFLSQ